MPTECSPDRMEFARVEGRAVVAGFDGGTITSDAGALLLGATDRAIGLVRRFAACFADRPVAATGSSTSVATLVGQRVFALALGYEDLVDHDTLRHDPVLAAVTGKLGRTSRRLRAAGRQVDAQPARARAGRGAHALPQDRPRRGLDRAAVRRLVPRRARHAARGDRARPRCHRRPAARRPGGAVLSRLLWLLLLPAALRLLRRPSAGGEAAAVEHRRQRRRGRGGRTDRDPDPRPLAAGADHPARRFAASPARR